MASTAMGLEHITCARSIQHVHFPSSCHLGTAATLGAPFGNVSYLAYLAGHEARLDRMYRWIGLQLQLQKQSMQRLNLLRVLLLIGRSSSLISMVNFVAFGSQA